MEGREVLQMMEKYYTFGIKSIFQIPVELILPAPARLCYRMLNKDHVKQITDSMIENPGMEPRVADFIPYNATLKKLVSYTGTDVDRQDLVEAVKKREIQFLAISGQHSARAAKNILEFAKKDAKFEDVANKLRYRKARIFSDKTPAIVLAKHSQRSNAVNQTMEYKSCFLDTIVHARRQFDELGRPKRPVIGNNKTNMTKNLKFQDYQVLAKITLNMKILKSLYWILFAEDALFSLWRNVCRLWLTGEIPDGANEMGKLKPAKLITVAMFRCFEGELTEVQISSILEAVKDKKILFKKDFSYKGDKLSMEDMSRKLKTAKKL
ncbi:unnamed protein product [Calypogeia fissa]